MYTYIDEHDEITYDLRKLEKELNESGYTVYYQTNLSCGYGIYELDYSKMYLNEKPVPFIDENAKIEEMLYLNEIKEDVAVILNGLNRNVFDGNIFSEKEEDIELVLLVVIDVLENHTNKLDDEKIKALNTYLFTYYERVENRDVQKYIRKIQRSNK